jgi:hypothetical protein
MADLWVCDGFSLKGERRLSSANQKSTFTNQKCERM